MPVGHLPETMPLTLPSALPASLQNSGPFKLAQIELRFHLAHAEDSLSELRHLLRITMDLRDYKVKQIGPSQRAGTRACNLINRFKDKLSRCAERYRAARNALLALDPTGEWGKRLQELKNEHIRAPGRGDGESEGFRQVSWIWMVARRCTPGQVSSPQQLQPLSDKELDGFQLVKEEMRRVLAFLEWKAVWWTEEGGGKLGVTPDIADGIRAYAAKQASINRKLAQSFEMHWKSGVKTQDRDRDREQDLEQDNLTDDCEYTGEADKYTAGAEFDTDPVAVWSESGAAEQTTPSFRHRHTSCLFPIFIAFKQYNDAIQQRAIATITLDDCPFSSSICPSLECSLQPSITHLIASQGSVASVLAVVSCVSRSDNLGVGGFLDQDGVQRLHLNTPSCYSTAFRASADFKRRVMVPPVTIQKVIHIQSSRARLMLRYSSSLFINLYPRDLEGTHAISTHSIRRKCMWPLRDLIVIPAWV
ncbi:hypothetical protein V8E52_004357 [Russula decolorans]